MLTDSTRVDQEDGCLIRISGFNEAFRLEMASHLVGIRDIHLAPVGAHVKLHNRRLYCIECTSFRSKTRLICIHSNPAKSKLSWKSTYFRRYSAVFATFGSFTGEESACNGRSFTRS